MCPASMVDAGGILGALSLGIQVFQGLKIYYTHFASYHDDLEAIIGRTRRLEAIFRMIKHPIQNAAFQDTDLSEVWSCLSDCLRGVKNLDTYRKKCGKPKYSPQKLKLKEQAGLIKKRVLYPFRKDTLEQIQKELDRLLRNVSVLLQAIQMAATTRHHEDQAKRSDLIQRRLSDVASLQLYQTEVIETLGTRSEQQRQHFEQPETQNRHQMGSQSTPLLAIANAQDTITEKINLVLSTVVELTKSQRSISPIAKVVDTLPHQRSERIGILQGVAPHSAQLSCNCDKALAKARPPGSRNYWYTWSTAPEHSPLCAFYSPFRKLTTARFGFRKIRRNGGFVFDIAMKWMTGEISHTITYRNIVPRRAPAFSIMDCIKDSIWYRGAHYTEDQITEAIELVTTSLMTLFEQGRAGVSDSDQHGSTLLHAVAFMIKAIILCTSERRLHHLDKINHLVDMLTRSGCPMNERGQHDMTPLDVLMRIIEPDDLGSLRLVDSDCSWRVGPDRVLEPYRTHKNYRFLALRESYSCDPLILSIFRQSEPDLKIQLGKLQPLALQEERMSLTLLYSALAWPEGLNTLLLQGLTTRAFHASGQSILDIAIRYGRVDTLDILLRACAPTTHYTWDAALESNNMTIVSKIAERMLSCAADYDLVLTRSNGYDLYFSTSLQAGAADILCHAGLDNVNFKANDYFTPLWYHARNMGSPRVNDSVKLIQWLLEKGAIIDVSHPHYRTTPAHILAERLVVICRRRDLEVAHATGTQRLWNDPNILGLATTVLTNQTTDSCRCLCSRDGCNVFTAAFRGHDGDWINDLEHSVFQTDLATIGRASEKRFFETISRCWGVDLEGTDRARSSVIRLMTFDILGLTHTCHKVDHREDCSTLHDPLTEQDIMDTQENELSDITLLEHLLIEFEEAWEIHTGTFFDFIDGFWRRRMSEKMLGREIAVEDDPEQANEHGVTIENPKRKLPLAENEMVPEESFEFLKWQIDKIMDGSYMEDRYVRYFHLE
ncbi:hypothetical protein K491DRAFT_282304 [Lophiostoma macrostomum CBS 122681]|uniref:Ankyrin n=1 Tax=Lophiostoma macrostomum CBS 122681 TaxID=1314788 RepID=A0A6A6TRX1_9PLEO|nr:hypothetical protein K491DRAFT_282304 [Lophiostoma macrostomum CBS 122681]